MHPPAIVAMLSSHFSSTVSVIVFILLHVFLTHTHMN